MVSKITMILEVLDDGKWHGIVELQERLELNEREVQEITIFLTKYDFVKIDKEHERVRINRSFQRLLDQTIT
ncbi:MAG: hypothetical protein JSW44_02190 [Candidatus Bathyarchaeota archaeon]|nr:MAG: hypothetical protein JSW44_02190 [Candidatus Bathyarchaeota archaeon]